MLAQHDEVKAQHLSDVRAICKGSLCSTSNYESHFCDTRLLHGDPALCLLQVVPGEGARPGGGSRISLQPGQRRHLPVQCQ